MEKLALALAPIVFIFTFVYLRDKYDREPLQYLIISFIFGVLTAFPVIIVEEFLADLTGTSLESGTFELLFYAFIVIAATEEVMKYLVLRFYNYPHKEFDEPYDGIMYGVAVSLGFAAIENVLYVFNYGMDTGWLRMFTAVPAHAMFGVLMGYFVGRAKFMDGKKNAFWERKKGLLIAVIFHGLYDYFLFIQVYEYLTLLAFVTLIVGIILAFKAMQMHKKISPHIVTEASDTEAPVDDPFDIHNDPSTDG